MSGEFAISGAEFLYEDEVRRIQLHRWRQQCSHVAENSEFYKAVFEQPLSGDLAQLDDLPMTDKEMLRADQQQNPPFGSYVAANPESIIRAHRTSGTTGTAMNLVLTKKDAVMTAKVAARAQGAGGLGPGFRVVHCLNYRLWMGGYSDHAGLEETGAMVVPYGVGDPSGLIQTILDLGIDAISCTPSYPAVLEQVLKRNFPGLEPRDLGLRLGQFGGESGLDDPAFRGRIENTWGLQARNSNYGVSDVMCNFAGQTECNNDLHFMAMDVIYPQLIDSISGTTLPWREGQSGELVLTHLCKQAQPLVRFRTGDIIMLTGLGKAECGRTAPRFRVIGRSDDMVVVRGINVFPAMVAAALSPFRELSGEYRIVLDSRPPYDRLPVEAELAAGDTDNNSLAPAIEQAIKKSTGASAIVTLRDPDSFPRTEGKTKRVFRSFEK